MRHSCAAVSLAALAMISGCMVGPDYRPPKTQSPPAWSGVTNATAAASTRLTTNAVDMAQWWTRFQDPKLTELVNAALRTNLDVKWPKRCCARRAPPAGEMRAVFGPP